MYPAPAPPSTSLHGELPIRAGEEEEEHHGKKPVLTKVKDKVKKLKNVISKKSHGHGDGGEDDDHHQHGDLDEGDDGFEEDEQINKDPAVHVVPMYESSAAGAGSKPQDMSGGGVGGNKGAFDGLGMIPMDFVKDQATPRADDETNARIEGSRVLLSPSTGARSGGEGNDTKDVGDGLGSIPVELVEDPAAPKTEAETNTRTEQIRGGEEVKMSPDLCRSLEAMTVSAENDRGETEHPKSANNSYIDKVSSAASKVYELVADAGTAVISKVKPVARKDGEAEAVGNQSKGISVKEYITEKLTPGEDEKALSELITEARQNKKNEAVKAPRPEGTGSDEAGRGLGVVGKIRESVTSFLGGGRGSPKSVQTESHMKVAEDKNELHGRPPDAIYQEKGSNEELPSSYH